MDPEQSAANKGVVTGPQLESSSNLRNQIAGREEIKAGYPNLGLARHDLTTPEANRLMADKHARDANALPGLDKKQ